MSDPILCNTYGIDNYDALHITFKSPINLADHIDLGKYLLETYPKRLWWLGDWFNAIPPSASRTDLLKALNVNHHRFFRYGKVAKMFEGKVRGMRLEFTHFVRVAENNNITQEERNDLLLRAEAENWDTVRIRKEVNELARGRKSLNGTRTPFRHEEPEPVVTLEVEPRPDNAGDWRIITVDQINQLKEVLILSYNPELMDKQSEAMKLLNKVLT